MAVEIDGLSEKKIEIQPVYAQGEEIKELFEEYTQNLVENDPKFAEYLAIQHYDSELEHLSKKYGLPDGRLYMVRVGGKAAGCIGLRKIDDKQCEMKRLYVRPEFRGHKIASRLVKLIIKDAKDIGYKAMLLDTLPFLKEALKLYRSLGFYEIECYNDSPMNTSIYMKLDLK